MPILFLREKLLGQALGTFLNIYGSDIKLSIYFS